MDPTAVLKAVPVGTRAAILMRHAEREPIRGVGDTVTAPLTDAGRAAAFAVGEHLVERGPLRFFHSPVPRCAETAERIAAGAQAAGGQAEVLDQLPNLGGPYMKDWQLVMERVLVVGAKRLTELWFSGKLDAELAFPALDSARQQLQTLVDQLADPQWQGLTINVSHDWNVLLVRHHFLEQSVAQAGWPGYMEGIAATSADSALDLHNAATTRTVLIPLPAG